MITASKLDLARHCPGSFALDHYSEKNEYQDEGVERHATFQEQIESGGVPERLAQRWPGATWRAEVKFAFDLSTGNGRELQGHAHRDYSKANPLEICGTADAVGLLPGRLIVVDFKSFDPNVPRAAVNAQVHIAALALCRAHGIDDADVAIHHEARALDVASIDVFDFELFAEEAKRIVEATVRARSDRRAGKLPQLSAGYWCRWCPAFVGCPLQKSLALEVSSADGVMSLEQRIPFESDDEAAAAYDLYQRIKMLSARIGAALYARASERPIPLSDGRVFGPVEKPGNERLDGDVVYQVIREQHGQSVADAAVIRAATKKRIHDALQFVAGKGQAAAMERKVMEAVRERGGSKREVKTVVETYEPQKLLKVVG